jgi:hypothetical protein
METTDFSLIFLWELDQSLDKQYYKTRYAAGR